MSSFRMGIAGGLLAVVGTAGALAGPAFAQDAPGAPRPADKCSFLGCLLHGDAARADAASAPQGAPPPGEAATPAAVPSAAADAGTDAREANKNDAPDHASSERGASKREAAKPAAVVTVAAAAAERPRLKQLGEVRPRVRLRVVAARSPDAELTLAPALDAAGGSRGAATLPLCCEELVVVAGRGINALADLRGKDVSFGPADGSTAAVARRLFAAAGVAVKETALDESNALDGLATGDLAAVVMLSAKPSPALGKLRAPDLHLIDWPADATLPAGARLETLARGAYPRLRRGDTHVVAVDAMLTLTAKGERSAAARAVFASAKQRTAALNRRGAERLGAAEPRLRQGRAVAKDKVRRDKARED